MVEKFRNGDTLDVELVIRHEVGIRDGYIIFVHEDDEETHLLFGFQGAEGKDKPLPASERTTLSLTPTIDEDQQLGVYALDRINFKTFDGSTVDAPIPGRRLYRFEVVDVSDDSLDFVDDPIDMGGIESQIVIEGLSISAAKE